MLCMKYVAFALSVLIGDASQCSSSCQFDAATANAGIDAGTLPISAYYRLPVSLYAVGNGAYTMYAATCGNPTNHT